MIRINLLSEGRKPVAAKKRESPLAALSLSGIDAGSLALIACLVLALLAAATHNLLLKGKVRAKNEEVAEAQVEVDRLAPIIAEVQEFKEKKVALENKVRVISDLRANQHGPVQFMDQISRALPELLWLQQMQVTGNTISISGEAFNVNAIAAFIENLDRVPQFSEEPVARDIRRDGNVYTFNLSFTFIYTRPDEVADSEEAADAAPAES